MNNQEILSLINIDQPAALRILRTKNIHVSDIQYSKFSKQELSIRLRDFQCFEQCLNHLLSFSKNKEFNFIYQYFDKEFIYNCLQIIPCYSCYKNTNYQEIITLLIQSGIKNPNKTLTYQLGKVYQIEQLNIEGKEDFLNRIKIHLPNNEIIPYTKEFKPPLILQSLCIEIPIVDLEKIGSMCFCNAFRRDIEDCPRCNSKKPSLTIICTPVEEIGNIQNEEQIQSLISLISDLESIKQQKLEMLKELNDNLNQNKFDASMVSIMKQCYKDYNQASILCQNYNQQVKLFYDKNFDQKELCQFSDCVECSRRVLQNAEGIEETLLRKIYFSQYATHKEKKAVVKLLQPTIKYSDISQHNNPEWYQEFCLQAQLYLKGDHAIEFIKQFLELCLQANLQDVIYSIVETLNSIIIQQQKSYTLYTILGCMNIENICLNQNLFSRLFSQNRSDIQDQLYQLVVTLSKMDEILALNILVNALDYSNNLKFYKCFDDVQIKTTQNQVIEYLITYIRNNHKIMDINKLIKCFQMIMRCWPLLENNQLKYYIELDKLQINFQNARIDEIFNQLYQSMQQINENQEFIQYLIMQLLNNTSNYQQIQRLSNMISNLLFKKLEFRIRVFPFRGNQQYLQRTELEYSSIYIDTLEQLKLKIQKDQNLEMPFDLIIIDRLVNDLSYSLDNVYKLFFVPEKAKLMRGQQRVLSMNAQQEQATQRQNQKMKEYVQQKTPLEVSFSIQGIGAHDDLPYLPILIDENKQKLQQQIASIIEPTHLKSLFTIINTLFQEGQRFMSTVTKMVNIMKFICNSSTRIKSLIINCQGIVVLIKIYLNDKDDKLLDFIDDLLAQTQSIPRRFSENIDPYELQFHDKESVQLLQQLIIHLEQQKSERIVSTICQIIPIVIRDLEEPIKYLIDYFKQNIKFEWKNEKLFLLSTILGYIPNYYHKLRQSIYDSSLYQYATELYLINNQNQEWYETNAACLKIIFSVAKGIKQCQQQIIQIGIIKQIFDYSINHNEKVKELQRVCNNFITFVKEDNHLIIEELKQLIQQLLVEREQQFGVSVNNKKNQIMKRFQKSSFNEKLQFIQLESGLQCIACKEGYSLNNNILGVYVYSLQYQIPEERAFMSMQIQETVGLQSVTYFTIIHYLCHRKSVDVAITQCKDESPKSAEEVEWNCAIKNNGCKCNNFLPLKGGNNYEQQLDFYFRRCERIIKQKIPTRCWILLNDLKGLLIRIARQDDLSADAGAGTYEHNLKLIPIMMSAILTQNITQYTHIMSMQQNQIEYILLAIVVSLFHPYQDWLHYKQQYMQNAKDYLPFVIQIVNNIMEKILKNVPNDTNYQKSLETFLSKDQQEITKQFETLQFDFLKK